MVSAGACSSETSGEESAPGAAGAADQELVQFCPGTVPLIYCNSITVPADASCQGYGALLVTQTCNLPGPVTCLQGLHLGDVPSIPQAAPPGPYPLGKTTGVPVTCTGAGGVQASCKEAVTVVDVTCPVITCPGDQVLSCSRLLPAGTAPTATDNCGAAPPSCDHSLTDPFADGTTTVTCSAVDGSGNASSCKFDVTVSPDTAAPPVINVGTPVVELWPPNHKPYGFDLSACGVCAVDACGASIPVDPAHAQIDRITSDEPEDKNGNGDGHTCNDILLGSDGFSATLLAERQGGAPHNGRVYTVYFTVKDASGNASSSSCQVQVPHDQSHAVVKDACQFCVGTGCGSCPGHDAACNY
ncbi:MAG: HYR domain-containing protein [Byssovorax sp.]